MSRRPYWEENGFTTEWYYHLHRIRTQHHQLTDADLLRMIRIHGEVCLGELRDSAARNSWWSERLKAPGLAVALAKPEPQELRTQRDLFTSLVAVP